MSKRKIIAFLMTFVMLFSSALMLFSCTGGNENTEPDVTINAENPDNDEEIIPAIKHVSFTETALKKSATGSIAVELSATVYPHDAAVDKSVDWHIEWGDPTKTEPVETYVKLVPDYDGSNWCTLYCYKAFEGEIIVTVVTREGGFFDTCICTFAGVPTSFEITSDETVETAAFGQYYALGSNTSHTFNLVPSNSINQVGDVNYEFEVIAEGSINTKTQEYVTSSGKTTWVSGTDKTINLSSITKVNNYNDTLFDVTISGNTLTVTVNCTLENYYASSERVSGIITYTDRFHSYTDDYWNYKIIVTETNSGLSQEICLRPVTGVTSVDLDFNHYTF